MFSFGKILSKRNTFQSMIRFGSQYQVRILTCTSWFNFSAIKMNGPPPLRYKPRKDRTAIWIALGATTLIFAVLIGWVANSVLQERQRLAFSEDTESKTSTTENAKPGLKVPAEKEINNETKPSTEISDGGTRSNIQKKSLSNGEDGGNVTGSNANTRTKRSGPLKLSDLPSYKKEPEPKRFRGNGDGERTSDIDVEKKGEPKEQPKPKPEIGKKVDPEFDNQNVLPQSGSEIKLYQELIVDRNPAFSMAGLKEFKQEFKFRAVSEILIKPTEKDGFRKVIQKIVAAKLLSADSISKKSLEESVKKLIGKTFTYTLDRRQKLFDFKGEVDKPKTLELKDLTSISGFTGEGMMMSSVMDLDGWREMAQLTFLLPDDKKKKWTDQMGHDWGDLGKWTGETRFEKKSKSNGLQRIDYAHYMTYVPNFGKSKLPFKIDSMKFNSSEAGGRLFFDEKNKRIQSLTERFKVNGALTTSLLGTSVKMTMSETQTFKLSLHEQNPQ